MGTLPDVGARDEAWFREFYRTEHGMVLAYARRRVPDPDDVVAEVFTTAWRLRTQLVEPVRPWLIRTALHVVLHARRSESRRGRLRARVMSVLPVPVDETELVLEREDAARLVAHALPALSRTDREILRLAAWEDLDTAQIAVVLDCSEAAARVRLHRARRRLRVLVDHDRVRPQPSTERSGPSTDPTRPVPRSAP